MATKSKYILTTPEFIRLEIAFGRWLKTLNYNPQAVHAYPVILRGFFYWLEENKISSLSQITGQTIKNYLHYLVYRENRNKGGRLSKNTIRSYITGLRCFTYYLQETGQESFEMSLPLKVGATKIKAIYSKEEISRLYNACADNIFGERDRAMLSIYYGCGLRRAEGVSLNVGDILFNKNVVYVRKGKNYKERYVPLSAGVKENLKEYINYIRPVLIREPCQALFLSQYGNRPCAESLSDQFQKLKKNAGIDKPGGLHCLRHSIATHLLQSGMELEQVRLFLGHSSLESTQIYTHIINDL